MTGGHKPTIKLSRERIDSQNSSGIKFPEIKTQNRQQDNETDFKNFNYYSKKGTMTTTQSQIRKGIPPLPGDISVKRRQHKLQDLI